MTCLYFLLLVWELDQLVYSHHLRWLTCSVFDCYGNRYFIIMMTNMIQADLEITEFGSRIFRFSCIHRQSYMFAWINYFRAIQYFCRIYNIYRQHQVMLNIWFPKIIKLYLVSNRNIQHPKMQISGCYGSKKPIWSQIWSSNGYMFYNNRTPLFTNFKFNFKKLLKRESV